MKSAITLCASILALAPAAWADIQDVKNCVESNMPRTSTVQKLLLQVEENGDTTFESRLTLYWRKLDDGERRIVLRFREPEDLARSALLVHARPRQRPRVYIYLADLGKPRSVSSRGELEGFLGRANLGIEELELLLDPLDDDDVTLAATPTSLGGRSAWTLEEELSDDDDARFARVVTYIDKEFCIPIYADFLDLEGGKKKSFEIDPTDVERIVDSWVPRKLVFHDHVRHSDTVLRVEEAEVDRPLAPALLTVDSLPKLSR